MGGGQYSPWAQGIPGLSQLLPKEKTKSSWGHAEPISRELPV